LYGINHLKLIVMETLSVVLIVLLVIAVIKYIIFEIKNPGI